jgi:4-hydroxy-3-polyprenylbenzoate decarboxylase
MAPGSTERRQPIAIAITGASGAVYATRTVAALLARGVHVELIVTDYGRRLLRDELGEAASVESLRPFLIGKYGAEVEAGTMSLHSNRDSGDDRERSHGCSGWSCAVLDEDAGGVAHGPSRSPWSAPT